MWKKVRGGLMFGVACIASPCCAPLIVPLGLTLLAGTPIAIWLSANIGWRYGGLTFLSIISLVVGLRWMGQNAESKRSIETLYKAAV
jgi:predicted MFS family arabinose efflux permease